MKMNRNLKCGKSNAATLTNIRTDPYHITSSRKPSLNINEQTVTYLAISETHMCTFSEQLKAVS